MPDALRDPDSAPDPITRVAVTRALGRCCRGESLQEDLAQMVYADLRRVATALLRREAPGHTLQATALVHEAWLRLVDTSMLDGEDREAARQRFLGFAVTAMRRILVEHARSRLRDKRGGDRAREPLGELAGPTVDDAQLLDLDAALQALAERRPRAARIAELRIYGGLSTAEAATNAGMSLTVAKTEWAVAQALLARWLRGVAAE